MGSDRQTFVAVANGRIVGTYYLRPNQAGGGDHVANCGYITDPAVAGQGVARPMAEHSIELGPIAPLSRHAIQLRGQHQRARGSPVAPVSGGVYAACFLY